MRFCCLFFFFLLIGLMMCSNTTCEQTRVCITDDSKCSGTYGDKCDPAKTDAQCCPQFSYCIDNKCVLDNYGATCTHKNDCKPDQIGTRIWDCISGHCKPQFNQGDKCVMDGDCWGQMSCVDGTCTGVKEGQACKGSEINSGELVGFDCAFGYICDRGACTKLKPEGANCTSSAECVLGTLCHHTCIKQYSLKEKSSCILGLCDLSSVCVNNTCQAGELYPKPMVCYTDKDCKNGHCSECNQYTGSQMCIADEKKPVLNCRKERSTLLDCFVKNNCSSTFAYQVGACQHDQCLIPMQAVWYCDMCVDEDSLGTCYGRFDINGHCIIPLPYWLIGAIVGGATVVLLLFLLMMCKIGDACHAEDKKNSLLES